MRSNTGCNSLVVAGPDAICTAALCLCFAAVGAGHAARKRLACHLHPSHKPHDHAMPFADNLAARDSEHALVMGHRLRRTAQRLTGLPDRRIGLSLFANEATVNSLIWRGGAGSQPWKVGGWVLLLGKAALPQTTGTC